MPHSARWVKNGFLNAIDFPFAIYLIYGSKDLKKAIWDSTLITILILILGSILNAFIITPVIEYMSGHSQVLIFIFYTLPLHLVVLTANIMKYKYIGEKAHNLIHEKPDIIKSKASEITGYDRLFSLVLMQSYRIMLYSVHALLVSVLYLIPNIGPYLALLQISALMTMCVFQAYFENSNHSKTFVEYYEKRWTYFLGFSFPFIIAIILKPDLMSYGMFMILYPLYLVIAAKANPDEYIETMQLRTYFVSEILIIQTLKLIKYSIEIFRPKKSKKLHRDQHLKKTQ